MKDSVTKIIKINDGEQSFTLGTFNQTLAEDSSGNVKVQLLITADTSCFPEDEKKDGSILLLKFAKYYEPKSIKKIEVVDNENNILYKTISYSELEYANIDFDDELNLILSLAFVIE